MRACLIWRSNYRERSWSCERLTWRTQHCSPEHGCITKWYSSLPSRCPWRGTRSYDKQCRLKARHGIYIYIYITRIVVLLFLVRCLLSLSQSLPFDSLSSHSFFSQSLILTYLTQYPALPINTMRSIITLLLASASVVVAQNATFPCLTETELDSKIPECARECQKTAIINDGCDYEDVGCHCLNTGLLGNYLIPCLANSTCSSDDLTGKL